MPASSICATLLGCCACCFQLLCFSRINASLFYSLSCHYPPGIVLTCGTWSCFIALACSTGSADSCSVFSRVTLRSRLLQRSSDRRLEFHSTLVATALSARRWSGLLRQ